MTPPLFAMFSTMPWWGWVGFLAFVTVMLALDLGVFNRRPHVVSLKEALAWCAVWFGLAMAFNLLLALKMPVTAATLTTPASNPALEFFTGYIIELCLSVDNVFVFIVIFQYFRVDPKHQHRVLFWGILGAVVMRAIFIFAGISLINQFHWIIYVFGAFLIFTGIKILRQREHTLDLEKNVALRVFRRFVPMTSEYHGQRFSIVRAGKRLATPLLAVLVLVEATDLVFALDSVPAIFAITDDPFIVYTSNVAAILGLRSLYFLLAGIMDRFHYLKYGLGTILTFVGAKMSILHFFHVDISPDLSLTVVLSVLAISIVASFVIPRKPKPPSSEAPG